MIDPVIFTSKYIIEKRDEYKCDPTILERTIFAAGLLEALVKSGAEFIFKGGSSLLFLLQKPFRLSTDIDIMISPGINILDYIIKASSIYPFIRYEEQIRKGSNNIEKRHFRFYYTSLTDSNKEIPILLDCLIENNNYSKLQKKEIKNDLIKTVGEPIYVTLPSIESLLGDKLTAFAPKTIGVKPITIKDEDHIVYKRIETIKQFFDVATLFDYIEDIKEVQEAYQKTAKAEMAYRGLKISIEECLLDTFNAAASIMSRGKIDSEAYKEYLTGIKGINGFLINIKFNAETARSLAAKVMYLAAIVLKSQPLIKEIPNQNLIIGPYDKLNYLKKLDSNSFNMAALAIKIIEN